MSLEVEEFPSLTNNNEDVSQTMESNSNQETDNEEEIEPLTAEINKKKRIPPIIIDESVNTPALMDEICTLLGFKIMARMFNVHTYLTREVAISQRFNISQYPIQ
ncbi:hypothetical protein NPIL_573861 [Nephila pilipes]|uniref:Uncharacterized protein n=1 Tax=Nephila pilipes TaxID=299642 RepID=A0A8X6QS98_NEPPI|nr:hypothetical protein NPIL_573861 [Nephila pilipes]